MCSPGRCLMQTSWHPLLKGCSLRPSSEPLAWCAQSLTQNSFEFIEAPALLWASASQLQEAELSSSMRDNVYSFSDEGGTRAFQEGTKGSKDLPESVLEVPSLHEVELNHGKQDLPDFSRPGSAAGEPIMKERALLQVRAQFEHYNNPCS